LLEFCCYFYEPEGQSTIVPPVGDCKIYPRAIEYNLKYRKKTTGLSVVFFLYPETAAKNGIRYLKSCLEVAILE